MLHPRKIHRYIEHAKGLLLASFIVFLISLGSDTFDIFAIITR